MNYLRSTCYLTAWADELKTQALLARTIIETPLVLFRDLSGAAHALLDQCPAGG
jgi:phenylpropionate dioxygenase-like ring-hydroxylating dioxygenase large terminal subunit